MKAAARRRGFGFEATPGSDDWWTPRWVFEAMGLTFMVDPCAGGGDGSESYSVAKLADRKPSPVPSHAFCKRTIYLGGLDKAWSGSVWLNPPYSDIDLWIEKFLDEVHTGVTLTYARTERPWCQRLLKAAGVVLFLGSNPSDRKHRVHFIPGPNNVDPATGKRREKSSPGGPSIMCGFGTDAINALRRMELAGHGVCR